METVDDEYRLLGVGSVECRKRLCWEAATAFVDGAHLEAVKDSWRQTKGIVSTRDLCAVVKAPRTLGCVYDVARGFGRRFQGVFRARPSKSCLSMPPGEFYSEVLRGKRGHGGRLVVLVADVLQYGLIDRACQGKAEVGVVTVAHVAKVLVRHRFKDGRGHLGQARLGVVAVVHLAYVPFPVGLPQVFVYVGQQLVGQVYRHAPAVACAQYGGTLLGGADAQRPVDAQSCLGVPGIAMYGQRKFDRHFAAFFIRGVG